MAEPWDTGVWNKCLKFVAEGKAEAKNNMVAIERAKYILVLRGAVKLGSSPAKGKGFFNFKRICHIISMNVMFSFQLALASPFFPMSMFVNVFINSTQPIVLSTSKSYYVSSE